MVLKSQFGENTFILARNSQLCMLSKAIDKQNVYGNWKKSW